MVTNKILTVNETQKQETLTIFLQKLRDFECQRSCRFGVSWPVKNWDLCFRDSLSEAELGSVKDSIEWEITGETELPEPQEPIQTEMESKGVVKCMIGTGVAILGICIAMMASSFHTIEEGHVGVYFKQGALVVRPY